MNEIRLTEVPRSLYVGHSWLATGNNRDALRVWLQKHKIDIAAVYNIEFRNNGFTVSRYLLDEGGKRKERISDVGRSGEILSEEVEQEYLPGLKPRLLREGRVRSS